ncbi:Single-stranded DNA-binding protein ssb [compost metagenome]
MDRPFTSGGSKEREADFINIVTWRQLAETCANYLRKGRLTAVEGRIQVRNYDNNEGKRVYVTEIVADNVRLLESSGGNREDGGSSNATNANAGYGGGSGSSNRGGGSREQQDPFIDDGKPIDISDDDLPF